jgi:DNA-binding CsgD family transcriptional regulator
MKTCRPAPFQLNAPTCLKRAASPLGKVPWGKIHEYLLDIESAQSIDDFWKRAVDGIGRLIPWDVAAGIFSSCTGDLQLGCGLRQKAREEYNAYYKLHIPFLPETSFPISSAKALVRDAVRWSNYRDTEYTTDFAAPNHMEYSLAELIPDVGLVFSLHRSRDCNSFSRNECLMLANMNQHVSNLSVFFNRVALAQGRFPSSAEVADRFPILSKREAEVLALLNIGLTAPETATKLFVSERTVESHIVHVYEKLNVRTKREAVNTVRSAFEAS